MWRIVFPPKFKLPSHLVLVYRCDATRRGDLRGPSNIDADLEMLQNYQEHFQEVYFSVAQY
jgi:hypothetical protein